MNTRIKINKDRDELFCIYSKERINIGERYVEIEEENYGEVIVKSYKPEYAPTEDDFEDLYVGE